MNSVLRDLTSLGAYYTGEHFVLKSGNHSEAYINPDVMLSDPYVVDTVTVMMAEPFFNLGHDVTCVGPAFGGNYLAWDVARHLGRLIDGKAKWIATAKSLGGGFMIEPDRGFEKLFVGSDVLVVEDLLTTGGSVLELIKSLRVYGDFNLIGVTAAVNRGGVTAADVSAPVLYAAANITVETDVPSACRWCAAGRPIVEDIGHGQDFKAKHPDYEGGYKRLLAA